jgi:hypothetical protein
VDARSLGTSRPPRFQIRRTDGERNYEFNPQDHEARVVNIARDFSDRRGRGGQGEVTRGERGGRGGDRGGRGRDRRANRLAERKKQREEDAEPDQIEGEEPLTFEELQWRRHVETNSADGPYEPGTSLEKLLKKGTPTCSSPQGLLSSISFKMQTGTNTYRKGYEHPNMHRYKMVFGVGVGVFEGKDEAKWGKEWLRSRRLASTRGPRVPGGLKEFTEEDLSVLSKAWAGGHHELPREAPLNDAVGQVGAYARRNETYVGEDAKRLEDKLREFLPNQTQGQQTTGSKKAPKTSL